MRFMRRKANTGLPRQVNTKQLELETAKEMLAEIFHARREDVEDMIHSRLEERSCRHECVKEERLWPVSFYLSEG
ncbi:MAG TPA: hypothetical protein PKV33_11600 [Methanothrix sp.]|nr:hypothetical protein [Methanothrix sp.]